MPKATPDIAPQPQQDLKSCPGGFVILRRLTYGEMLDRQDMAAKMAMTADTKSKTAEAVLSMAQSLVADYEFARCIVDHNLEDDNGSPLNFQVAGTVRKLDPRIGAEISELIDSLNQLPEDELGK